MTEQLVYAECVFDGDYLESEDLPNGWLVDYYLTGPLNIETTENLRYGYFLQKNSPDGERRQVEIERDGFSNVDQAGWHAKRVVLVIDGPIMAEGIELEDVTRHAHNATPATRDT